MLTLLIYLSGNGAKLSLGAVENMQRTFAAVGEVAGIVVVTGTSDVTQTIAPHDLRPSSDPSAQLGRR